MSRTLDEFIRGIADYSDKELERTAIFDAAQFCPNPIGFDIIANAIVDELIKRELRDSRFFYWRAFIKDKILPLNDREERLDMYRQIAAINKTTNSDSQFEDLEAISMSYNDYSAEPVDLEEIIKRMTTSLPLLPRNYEWTSKNELFRRHPVDKRRTIYPGIIYIKSVLRDIDDDPDVPIRAEVCFIHGDEEITRRINLADLYWGGASMKKLANASAAVSPKNAGPLGKYFSAYIHELGSTIKTYLTTHRVGWVDNEYTRFVPYDTEVIFDSDQYKKEYRSISQSQGKYEEWATLVNEYRDDEHIPYRIMLATSFASVLASPLGGQSFIVHVHGRSQTGKSPALRLIASVWANPDPNVGYIKSLGGGDNALELGAQFYGSLPYCLDESQLRIANKKHPSLTNLIHLLTEEIAKPRGKGGWGLMAQRSWCNAIIFNGEVDSVSDSANLGEKMRVFDLPITNKIFSQDNKETTSFIKRLSTQFNTAGREFIRRFINEGGKERAIQLYEEFLNAIPYEVEDRQRNIAATILTADSLIVDWFFEDDLKLTLEDILPYLKTRDVEPEEADYAKIQEAVYEWIRGEIGEDYSGKSERGRVVNNTMFAFYDEVTLSELIRNGGGELSAYLSWARENGILAAKGGDGYTRNVSHIKGTPDHKARLYVIKLPTGA